MAATDRRQHWLNVLFPDTLDFPGKTEGVIVPSGTTAERPVLPVNGTLRYNISSGFLEAYVSGVWGNVGTAGSGVTDFVSLSDTPGGYTGLAGDILRINVAETGLEFIDGDTLFLPITGGTMSAAATIAMNGGTILNVPPPSAPGDVANKQYVDGVSAGLDPKESVRAATTGAIALTGTQTIDTVAVGVGDRVLVKNQGAPVDNGIYLVSAGAWSRSPDQDGSPASEVSGGNFVFVEAGGQSGSGWVVVHDGNINLGVDAINWTQFVGGGATQNLWETFTADAGTVFANIPTDTFTFTGGTGISTAIAGDTLTITNSAPNVDQNVWETIVADSGTTVANTTTDVLTIAGGTNVSTSIVGDSLVINATIGAGDSVTDADADTRIRVEAAPDEDIIRFDTGDSPGGFAAQPNIMRLSSALWDVDLGIATGGAGAPISLQAGGVGPGTGGNVDITGGGTPAGTGGVTTINGGYTDAGPGGALILSGGASGVGGADATLRGGNTAVGVGGAISIYGGTGPSSGTGGAMTLRSGNGGAGGNMTIMTGSSSSGQGGDIGITAAAGAGGAYSGGSVTVYAGNGAAGFDGRGGDVFLVAGDSNGTQQSGAITLLAGTPNGSAVASDVTISARSATSGNNKGGHILLTAGQAAGSGFEGGVHIRKQGSAPGELRIFDDNDSNYIGFTVPSAVTPSEVYTLPQFPGVGGQVLSSTTGGVMSWVTPSASPTFPLLAPDGTNAAPSYAFSTGGGTDGMYLKDSNTISFSINGTSEYEFNPALFNVLNGRINARTDGTLAFPSVAWGTGANNGFYESGAETRLVINGALRMGFEDAGVVKVFASNYETLVLADDDVPNKKYVDDAISSSSSYDLSAQAIGVLGTSAPTRIYHMVATRAFRISGTALIHQAVALTGPTGTNATFSVSTGAPGATASIGTVTFTTGGGNNQSVTFTLAQTDVAIGDIVEVDMTVIDSNNILADVMITINATEL